MGQSTFMTWGCRVVISTPTDTAAGGVGRAERLVRSVLRDIDETCSRFRPESDLSAVNRQPGRWVDVDPLLVAAVSTALEAARRTDGLVDPLLGRRLVLLGYDRDLRRLRVDSPAVAPGRDLEPPRADLPAPTPGAWREVRLREAQIQIPPATALDLGATAKAWAADLAARKLAAHGLAGAVSVGGDVSVTDDRAWPVAISEVPEEPPCARVDLHGGGLATSSTQVRRWTHHGVRRHHLLDPRTGLPAPGVWRTVSVAGPSCVAANTFSTAAVVQGHDAPHWLTSHGVAARLVAADGQVVRTPGWPADDALASTVEGQVAS